MPLEASRGVVVSLMDKAMDIIYVDIVSSDFKGGDGVKPYLGNGPWGVLYKPAIITFY